MSRKAKYRPEPTSPRRKSLPAPSVIGRRAVLPGADTSGARMCWRFTHLDHDGPWCFDTVVGGDLCEILRHMASLESMTVSEVFPGGGKPGKDYDVDGIPTVAARERLDDIGLADMTKISVLRLTGEKRLYGFRDANVFYVVWWDPLHQIWPSRKKHT
jgi:hypothetical protein